MSNYFLTLLNNIEQVTTPEQQQWLEETLTKLEDSQDLDSDLLLSITRARRFVGHSPLGSNADAISTAAGDLQIRNWEAGNAARVALLLKAISVQPEREEAIVTNTYRMGDESEKTAFIAGIALYADDDQYKGLAVDSGRTNSLILFQALAINNPYPTAYYSEAEFNQLVLKSLFMGVNTEHILGLENRVNKELSRMCEDYYDERVAAQRSVPADIWLSIMPYASDHGIAIMAKALSDDDREHRYYAALSANRYRSQSTDLSSIIKTRLDQENDEHISELLSSFLNH